jgi:hypothetical protein
MVEPSEADLKPFTMTWTAPSFTPPNSTLAVAAAASRLAKPSSAVASFADGGEVDTMVPRMSPYHL